ncbi:MAG: uroporphyrinogen-III synthase, partial [Comamonadaceae bacterium]
MPLRRVIVTRPAREAVRWVDALRLAGLDAVALPLIAIAAMPEIAPLRHAHARLGDHAALMFVSAAAVAHFFEVARAPSVTPRCWATGPGTVQALKEAGVAMERIDAPPYDAG